MTVLYDLLYKTNFNSYENRLQTKMCTKIEIVNFATCVKIISLLNSKHIVINITENVLCEYVRHIIFYCS